MNEAHHAHSFSVAVAALVAVTAASPAAPIRLTGTVGPGFTISLKRDRQGPGR